MSLDTFPMIKLELGGMRRAIIMAFQDEQLKMDEDVQKAVDAYCNSGHLKELINKEVYQTLDQAIKKEVNDFFMWGEGRKVVAAAVKEKLLKKATFTPLDEV